MNTQIRLTYNAVFNSETGQRILSKWWMTQSCADAYERERQAVRQRLAELKRRKADERAATQPGKLCKECHKTQVNGKQRYCSPCARSRHRESKRLSILKQRSLVDKNRRNDSGERFTIKTRPRPLPVPANRHPVAVHEPDATFQAQAA